MDVERTVFVERAARLALVARLASNGVETVYRLGEDTRTGGLAHAARSAEEVGVSQLSALDSIFKGRGYMTLTDNRSKGRRTILAC